MQNIADQIVQAKNRLIFMRHGLEPDQFTTECIDAHAFDSSWGVSYVWSVRNLDGDILDVVEVTCNLKTGKVGAF